MNRYAAYTPNGEILISFSGMTLEESQLSIGDMDEELDLVQTDGFPTKINPSLHYVFEGGVLLRPETPTEDLSGITPFQLDLFKYAAGSSATIANQDGETLDIVDMSAEISLVDAGIYRVSVSQPFPHHELSYEVTVT